MCCTSSCCNKCFLAVIYGVMLFVMWIIFIAVGGVVTGASIVGPQQVQDVCDGKLDDNERMKVVMDTIHQVDNDLVGLMNERMCGLACPCEETPAKPWTSLSEGDLKKYKRTKEVQSSPSDDKDAEGNFYIVTVADGDEEAVQNYKECLAKLKSYNDDIVANGGEPSESAMTPEQEEKVETAYKVVSYFEKKYSCSGICDVGLFYASLPVKDGVPQHACASDVQIEIKNSFANLGYATLIIGLLMFVMWIF